jgi:replicative DNA helicase
MSGPIRTQDIPPHNAEAERAVLGALFCDPGAFDDVRAEGLDASSFHLPQHREIFSAIDAVIETDARADVVTVSARLEQVGTLEQVGGLAYIGELDNEVPTAAQAVHYARLVVEDQLRRMAIEQGHRQVEAAFARVSVSDLMVKHREIGAEFLAFARRRWPEPRPLGGGMGLPDFPVDVFPSWLRDWVEGVAQGLQVPPDLPAMVSLGMLAVACGGRSRVRVRAGWSEGVNLYTVVALPPSDRKSPVIELGLEPVGTFEDDQAEYRGPAIREAREDREVLEARLKIARTRASKARDPADRTRFKSEAVDISTELDATPVPRLPRLYTEDVTPERVATLMSEHEGRMAVISDEGGGIFEIAGGRYSNNKRGNIEVFLKGHSSSSLRVDRNGKDRNGKEREAVTIPRAVLSMVLVVQPGVIARLGENTDFSERGFVARPLYALPVSLVGRRDARAEPMADAVQQEYTRRVLSLLNGNLPPTLECSRDARAQMVEMLDAIEPRIGPGGDLEFMHGWGGKLCGQTARIAALLHLAQSPDSALVSVDTVLKARRVADYLIEHAKAAFGLMGADRSTENARRILDWVEKRQDPIFKARDLYQGVKRQSRFSKMPAVLAALAVLEEHGYVRLDCPRGKRTTIVSVNPNYISRASAE